MRRRALVERIEALEAEVAELREANPGWWTPPPRPAAVSEPVDFGAMADDLATRHAAYVDDGDEWGATRYL